MRAQWCSDSLPLSTQQVSFLRGNRIIYASPGAPRQKLEPTIMRAKRFIKNAKHATIPI